MTNQLEPGAHEPSSPLDGTPLSPLPLPGELEVHPTGWVNQELPEWSAEQAEAGGQRFRNDEAVDRMLAALGQAGRRRLPRHIEHHGQSLGSLARRLLRRLLRQ